MGWAETENQDTRPSSRAVTRHDNRACSNTVQNVETPTDNRQGWDGSDNGREEKEEEEKEMEKEEEEKKEVEKEEEDKEDIIHGNPPTKCVVWVHQLKMSLLCKWILICLYNPSSWRIKKDSSKLFKNVSL